MEDHPIPHKPLKMLTYNFFLKSPTIRCKDKDFLPNFNRHPYKKQIYSLKMLPISIIHPIFVKLIA